MESLGYDLPPITETLFCLASINIEPVEKSGIKKCM